MSTPGNARRNVILRELLRKKKKMKKREKRKKRKRSPCLFLRKL